MVIKEKSELYKRHAKYAVTGIVILCIIAVAFMIILKYEVEGEKNMPFVINKIVVASTLSGKTKDEQTAIWDIDLLEKNDIYMYVSENIEYSGKEEKLRGVTFQNIQMIKKPKLGEINFYKQDAILDNLNSEENKLIENHIEYRSIGEGKTDSIKLASKGGVVAFRILNEKIGTYISNEDVEIKYNLELLKKSNITIEEINFEIQFDIIIELESGKSFKTDMKLEIPEASFEEKSVEVIEKTDLSELIFKRI